MQKASKSQRNQLTRQNKGLKSEKGNKVGESNLCCLWLSFGPKQPKQPKDTFGCPLACLDTVQRRQKEGKEGKRRKKKHKKAKGNCHFPDVYLVER